MNSLLDVDPFNNYSAVTSFLTLTKKKFCEFARTLMSLFSLLSSLTANMVAAKLQTNMAHDLLHYI